RKRSLKGSPARDLEAVRLSPEPVHRLLKNGAIMKQIQLRPISLGLGVLLLGAAGCHRPTEQEYDDVATHVGALSADAPGGDSEPAREPAGAAKGGLPDGLPRMGMGTITGKRGQLTYDFDLTCKDAMGQVQSACGDTTDSAHLVLHWTGDLETLRYKAT